MGIQTIIAPAGEPITLTEARGQCNIFTEGSPPSSPADPMLAIYAGAAREWAEQYTGVALATQTLEMALDAFPTDEIEIPLGPVQSIVSVTYVDDDQVEQTIDPTNYTLDRYSDRIWLLPAHGFTWPTPGDFANAVKIRWVAGYSLADESPQTYVLPVSAKLAMLLVLAHLYRNREETVEKALTTIPMGAKVFLEKIKVRSGMA